VQSSSPRKIKHKLECTDNSRASRGNPWIPQGQVRNRSRPGRDNQKAEKAIQKLKKSTTRCMIDCVPQSVELHSKCLIQCTILSLEEAPRQDDACAPSSCTSLLRLRQLFCVRLTWSLPCASCSLCPSPAFRRVAYAPLSCQYGRAAPNSGILVKRAAPALSGPARPRLRAGCIRRSRWTHENGTGKPLVLVSLLSDGVSYRMCG
jgi:hypothetical protein